MYPFVLTLSFIQVTAGVLSVILSLIDIDKNDWNRQIANTLNHTSVGLVVIALFCDVIKMNFGLDPAIHATQDKLK